jgi:hypothetical protein
VAKKIKVKEFDDLQESLQDALPFDEGRAGRRFTTQNLRFGSDPIEHHE